jgi:hypothetical protein
MTESHPDAQEGGSGLSILNVGYGLGIVRSHSLSTFNLLTELGRPYIPTIIP